MSHPVGFYLNFMPELDYMLSGSLKSVEVSLNQEHCHSAPNRDSTGEEVGKNGYWEAKNSVCH